MESSTEKSYCEKTSLESRETEVYQFFNLKVGLM